MNATSTRSCWHATLRPQLDRQLRSSTTGAPTATLMSPHLTRTNTNHTTSTRAILKTDTQSNLSVRLPLCLWRARTFRRITSRSDMTRLPTLPRTPRWVARKARTQQTTIALTNLTLERPNCRGMRRAGDGFLSPIASIMVYVGGGVYAFCCVHSMFHLQMADHG